MDPQAIATVLILGMLAEMRVAVWRTGRGLAAVQSEQARFRALHALPPLLLCAALCLAGCEEVRPAPTFWERLTGGGPGHTATAGLVSLGYTCEWIGGLALLAAAAARSILIAEIGGGLLVGGFAFAWLGTNTWVFWVVLAVGAGLLGFRWYRRARAWIADYWHAATDPPAIDAPPPAGLKD